MGNFKTRSIYLLIIFSVIIMFTACVQVEGPQGPKGEQGVAGQDGQDGAPGIQGPEGSTDVKSYSFLIDKWDQRLTWLEKKVVLAAITEDINDNGMVHVYWKNFDGEWLPVPYSYSESGIVRSIGYAFSVGNLRFYLTVSSGELPTNYGLGTYRAVIVPGNAGKKDYDVDWSNYSDVAERFGFTTD